MTNALDGETFGDALESDSNRSRRKGTNKVGLNRGDRNTGAGIPDHRVEMGLADVIVRSLRRHHGGSESLGGVENPFWQRSLGKVSFESRREEDFSLGRGKSRSWSAVARWVGGGAAFSLAIIVHVANRALLFLLLLHRRAPIISLSSNATEGDGTGKGMEGGNGIGDQRTVAMGDRKARRGLATETVGGRSMRVLWWRNRARSATDVLLEACRAWAESLWRGRTRRSFVAEVFFEKNIPRIGSNQRRAKNREQQTQQPTNRRKKVGPVGREEIPSEGPKFSGNRGNGEAQTGTKNQAENSAVKRGNDQSD